MNLRILEPFELRDESKTPESRLSRPKSWRETWAEWAWVFASMPIVFILVLVSHAVHIRVALGHWPRVFGESPINPINRVLIDIHEFGLVLPAFFATLLSLPLWLMFARIAWPEFSSWFVKQVICWAGSAMLLFLLFVWLRDSAYVVWLLD